MDRDFETKALKPWTAFSLLFSACIVRMILCLYVLTENLAD